MNFLDPARFFIPLETLPWQPILGKICKVTFIQHAGISQQIQISQFRLRDDKGNNFCYIQCNFGEDRSTNTKILQGVSVPFGTRRQKSIYHTKYLSKYWVQMNDLDLIFQYLKGRCYGTQFCEKMANSALSSIWHSEMEWDNALYMPLHCVKFW